MGSSREETADEDAAEDGRVLRQRAVTEIPGPHPREKDRTEAFL